ncbi:MAG: RNA polymerase sporulation sigma factor SigH [Lachnospiraceae bacterium]|nr:RNA polymerase sporulation sigma factor SigH [Lachnospiraceae bacterium]
MRKYQEAEDDKIIEWVTDGDSDALDYLMRKYTDMVKREARKLYLIGADEEDLIQEGMLGLFKAIRDYRIGRESGFSSFARMCILRQMYTAVAASNRQKHQPLNSYVSFDEPAFNGETKKTIEELITADEKNTNPEQIVLDKEQADMIESVIVERLSSYEKKVLKLYLEGQSYDSIAEELHKSRKGVDNAIQRIRRKFSSINRMV